MISQIIITSLCIIGIYFTTLEGNIFFPFRQFCDFRLPVWIKKPMYDCLTCMSSIYGTIAWLYFNLPPSHSFIELAMIFLFAPEKYIVFIFALAGLNGIIDYTITRVKLSNGI